MPLARRCGHADRDAVLSLRAEGRNQREGDGPAPWLEVVPSLSPKGDC